jgi:hypothetical protein
MEGSCSTGQSPQRAVVPVEEEDENSCSHYMIPDHSLVAVTVMTAMILSAKSENV